MFVVEDGTGLANANSYGSFAGYVAYWTDRGAVPGEAQAVIEAALIKATDYLGFRYCWRGIRLTTAQALDWPRHCAYAEAAADGYWVPIEGVPVEVVKATYELGKRALAGELAPDPTTDETGQIAQGSRIKVGPIEEELTFSGSGPSTFKRFPAVDQLLRNLVTSSGARVYRA